MILITYFMPLFPFKTEAILVCFAKFPFALPQQYGLPHAAAYTSILYKFLIYRFALLKIITQDQKKSISFHISTMNKYKELPRSGHCV